MLQKIEIYWLAFRRWLFDAVDWEDAVYYAETIIKKWR